MDKLSNERSMAHIVGFVFRCFSISEAQPEKKIVSTERYDVAQKTSSI